MARIDESIFLLGKVTYNTFDIDFAIPFEDQEDKLSEDLIQVEYDTGYIIDVGWYPEMDPKGCLKVVLIKDYDWNVPVESIDARNIEELYKAIVVLVKKCIADDNSI